MLEETKAAIKQIEEFESKYGKPPAYIEVTPDQFDRLKKEAMPYCTVQTGEFCSSILGIEIRIVSEKESSNGTIT